MKLDIVVKKVNAFVDSLANLGGILSESAGSAAQQGMESSTLKAIIGLFGVSRKNFIVEFSSKPKEKRVAPPNMLPKVIVGRSNRHEVRGDFVHGVIMMFNIDLALYEMQPSFGATGAQEVILSEGGIFAVCERKLECLMKLPLNPITHYFYFWHCHIAIG
ncbi:hypothetical protein ACFE04_013409 [Oxalis oulophora]